MQVEKEMLQDQAVEGESLQDLAQQPFKGNAHEEKIFGLVQETIGLFKDRMASGELTAHEVAEAFAVAMSGTIYSVVPPQHQKNVQREAEGLTRKTLKTFDQQTNKKNSMFASQLLAAAKIASYVMAHGNRVMEDYRQGASKAAEEAMKDIDSKLQK